MLLLEQTQRLGIRAGANTTGTGNTAVGYRAQEIVLLLLTTPRWGIMQMTAAQCVFVGAA